MDSRGSSTSRSQSSFQSDPSFHSYPSTLHDDQDEAELEETHKGNFTEERGREHRDCTYYASLMSQMEHSARNPLVLT